MNARILIDNVAKDELISEWGLSILIDYQGHKVLLDAGTTGCFMENVVSMGADIRDVEFGVLSHAHYDHSDGLETFFKENHKASFYIREGAKENCYGGDSSSPRYIGIQKGLLEAYKKRLVFVSGDYEIVPGVALIPHKTSDLEEIGEKAKMYVEVHGKLYPDSFDHEQSLVFDTKKGLVIFNSCSHSGADIIIDEVSRSFPGKKVYGYIGGLHLFQSSDQDVLTLAEKIKNTGVEKMYTGHCTGERAMVLLKEVLGDRIDQFYTGMTIHI